MKYLKSYWFLFLAAVITMVGLITGWYFFLFLILPFGFFKFGNKDKEN